jgi:Sulfotransferase domain
VVVRKSRKTPQHLPPHETPTADEKNSIVITIVSGLPRSGTSLMMQMLAAAGLPILSDGERQADVDNPRGYLEWDRIKQLPTDPSCIAEAEGKAVKVISRLLLSLPEGHDYRIIFMQRPLAEVLASQEVMLRHRGTAKPGADAAAIAAAFESHLREVHAWLDSKTYVRTLRIPYHEVLRSAKDIAQSLTRFLEIELNTDAMTHQVDATLYRNRSR